MISNLEKPCSHSNIILDLAIFHGIGLSQDVYKLSDTTCRVEGDLISLEKIRKNLPQLDTIKTLEIFCSVAVIIDTDLQLPGIQLIIVAPKWEVVSAVTIDL